MENPAQTGKHSKVILGVDDSPEDLAFLNITLSSAGYTFMSAANGVECLSLVLRVMPRLILLDVQMPNFDGYEVCRRLRKMRQVREIPVAFLTARKTGPDVKEGRAAGGNDFIIKPIERGPLLERVQYWMSRRPKIAA